MPDAQRDQTERHALFGQEIETTVVEDEDRVAMRRGDRRHPPPAQHVSELTTALFRHVAAEYGGINAYLRNGARLYLDVGSHPEYATPEMDSLYKLVVAIRAGEEIMGDMPAAAIRFRGDKITPEQRLMLGDPGKPRLGIFGTTRDHAGNSTGCHENYLLYRQRWGAPGEFFPKVTRNTTPFFVTRQVTCGAGHLQVTGGKGKEAATYRVSQKWDGFVKSDQGYGSGTMTNRPFINTRDEPHADAEKYRRFHVIVGDANRSEYTTWLKFGSTQLVLDMIADGVDFSGLELANTITALDEVSADPECRKVLELADPARARAGGFGDYMTGDGITSDAMQRAYLDRARSHFLVDGNRGGLNADETKRTIEMWQHTVDALSSHDLDHIRGELGRQIDWVIKYNLMEGYRLRNDLPETSPRLQLIDLDYHRYGSNTLFERLESGGRGGDPVVDRIADPADVAAAVHRAPEGTRARLRGDWIGTMRDLGYKTTGSDWVHLAAVPDIDVKPKSEWPEIPVANRFGGDAQSAKIQCKDPFAAQDSRVDETVAAVRAGFVAMRAEASAPDAVGEASEPGPEVTPAGDTRGAAWGAAPSSTDPTPALPAAPAAPAEGAARGRRGAATEPPREGAVASPGEGTGPPPHSIPVAPAAPVAGPRPESTGFGV